MPYPLGAWVGEKFVFKSPEAEKQWHGDSFEQGSNHLLWMKGRRLRPDESALAGMGLPRSDDTYLGPDGQRYQTTLESREDPHLAMLRAAHLAAEPAQGSATEMGLRASQKALPQAMAMMAQGARAEAQPPAANDNRAAANDNHAAPTPSSSSVPASNVAPAVPVAAPPNPAAAPKPKTLAERAAYGRSGHVTDEERQASSDDLRLLFSGATAGYGDNAFAALKALGDYAGGKEFSASYDASLSAEQRKTEEARNRAGIAGALIESLPSFIPGYGDVTGLIADLKMYREHPEERTWQNIAITAAGLLPFIPSTAGTIRRVDRAVEAAADGAKAAAKGDEKVARLGTEQAKSFEKTDALSKADPSLDYRANFFDEYPHLAKEEIEIHHAVPQRTLTRYPGLMTEVEMHAIENLRGIPKTITAEIHQGLIHAEWNRFYRDNLTTTLERLKEKAAEIDRKYGHLFLPRLGDSK